MVKRYGATAMGLKPKWQYQFVGDVRGRTIPNFVFLDVGNCFAPGALDQHHDERLGASTTELIYNYPEMVYDHLMLEWEQRHQDGKNLSEYEWRPTLVTHFNPDFDGVVSIFLVQKLILDGVLPRYTQALVQYSSAVDQGQINFRGETSLHELHLVFLQLQAVLSEARTGHKSVIDYGLALLNHFFKSSEENGTWFRSAADFECTDQNRESLFGVWTALFEAYPHFKTVKEKLDADLSNYTKDFEGAETLSILLPTKEGREERCDGVLFTKDNQSALFKYRARQTYPFMLKLWSDDNTGRIRAIPSLDESKNNRFNLRGLGYTLELAETKKRKNQQERKGLPRFGDGYCTNSDPWYDGRGHAYTIVDAPRQLSCLSEEEVREIVCGGAFWKTQVSSCQVVVFEAAMGSTEGDVFDETLRCMALPQASQTDEPWAVQGVHQIGHPLLRGSVFRKIYTRDHCPFDQFVAFVNRLKSDSTVVVGFFQVESYIRHPQWLNRQVENLLNVSEAQSLSASGHYFFGPHIFQSISQHDEIEEMIQAISRCALNHVLIHKMKNALEGTRSIRDLEGMKLQYHYFQEYSNIFYVRQHEMVEELYQRLNKRLYVAETEGRFLRRLEQKMSTQHERQQHNLEILLYAVGLLSIFEIVPANIDAFYDNRLLLAISISLGVIFVLGLLYRILKSKQNS